MYIKDHIKNILQYRIEGTRSVISIGKRSVSFERRQLLLNKIHELNEKTKQLFEENNDLQIKLRASMKASTDLGRQCRELEERIEDCKKELTKLRSEAAQLSMDKQSLSQSLAGQQNLVQKKDDEIASFHARYMEAVWCSGWTEHWKRYFYENYPSIESQLERIEKGVDGLSRKTLELFLERNFYIFPEQKYCSLFRFDHDHIFQDWELEGIQEGLPEEELREKYHIDEGIYLETPVFKFHCGLSLLPDQIQKRVEGKDVIDGGAFWGDSALVFESYKPRSIHAFEPMKENYKELGRTKEKNHLSNLVMVPCGLGDREACADIYYHEMLSGASLIPYKAIMREKPELHVDTADLTTIDSYKKKYGLDIGLIKLDIEGNELEAVQGAEETIRQDKPVLLISVYHQPKDLFEIKPLIESWNLGYHFMFRKLCFHDPLTEVSLIGYVL